MPAMPHPIEPRRDAVPSLLRQLDVPLLQLFDTIYKIRNLTLAAERLCLSQPAVSRGLARLREVYGDQLFVRQPGGLAATPFAETLVEPLAFALDTLQSTLQKTEFDATTSRRVFKIAMSDIGERLFLPVLSQHLTQQAPGVGIQVVAPTLEDLRSGLASGEVDLAVGFFANMGKQFHHQRLFRERFIYVARQGHPVVKGSLTVALQASLPHVISGSATSSHASVVRRALATPELNAPVAMQVQSFLSVAPIVASTDLIAALPSNLARVTAKHMRLQLIEPPLPLPSFEVVQNWHQRFHRDAASTWLRQVFLSLFRDFDFEASEPLTLAPR
jgi:DNA-binding transcriptional LysR family regulator